MQHTNSSLDNILNQALIQLDIDTTVDQKQALLAYLDNLLLWNKAYNLTAIDNKKTALIKHIIDCLAVLPYFDDALQRTDNLQTKTTPCILDIGTGAGLPACILAILRPSWQIVALDSNQKKIRFIRQIKTLLNLTNLTPTHARIEDFVGQFDIITSRAFSNLSDFVRLSENLLHKNGVYLALKGKIPASLANALLMQDTVHDDLSVEQSVRFSAKAYALDVPFLNEVRCVVKICKKGVS